MLLPDRIGFDFFLFHRWKIAIKTNRVVDTTVIRVTNRSRTGYSHSSENDMNEVSSLMEEAKTMWKVGSYHENIVNLQGITVGVENGSIRKVCFILVRNVFDGGGAKILLYLTAHLCIILMF